MPRYTKMPSSLEAHFSISKLFLPKVSPKRAHTSPKNVFASAKNKNDRNPPGSFDPGPGTWILAPWHRNGSRSATRPETSRASAFRRVSPAAESSGQFGHILFQEENQWCFFCCFVSVSFFCTILRGVFWVAAYLHWVEWCGMWIGVYCSKTELNIWSKNKDVEV